MFEVGEYIIYGSNNVCRVEAIGTIETMKNDKVYYTLTPLYERGSKVFTPIDNTKVVIRKVISEKEAKDLLEEIKDIEELVITDEKNREKLYKEEIDSCDCKELVRIIKTLYNRKMERIKVGKKMTSSDERYYHMAEKKLYGELALVLNMDIDNVKEKVGEIIR